MGLSGWMRDWMIGDIRSRVTMVLERVEDVQMQLTEMNERITSMGTVADQIEEKIVALTTGVDSIIAFITTLNTNIQGAVTLEEAQKFMSEIDAQKDRLAAEVASGGVTPVTIP